MLTLQITCSCGHFAKVTDNAAIDRWKRMEPTRFRCSHCGRADRIETRLAWDASVNPLADSKEDDG